jgi:hypothetical protein
MLFIENKGELTCLHTILDQISAPAVAMVHALDPTEIFIVEWIIRLQRALQFHLRATEVYIMWALVPALAM